MQRSLWQAIEAIRQGLRQPVYLVCGAGDGYAVRWLADEIRKQIAEKTEGEVDVIRHHLAEVSFSEVLNDTYGGSLFGTDSISVCTGFEYVTTTYKSKADDQDVIDGITTLLDQAPESPLILATVGEKLDERKKLVKKILASPSICVTYATQHHRDEWYAMTREILGEKLVLTNRQMEAFIERTGKSLGVLALEADKLRLYVGEHDQISDQEFDLLISGDSEADIFSVVRLAVTKQIAAAYEAFERLSAGDTVFAFLALLARQYRLIARVKTESVKGRSDAQLASTLGVHPYACKVAREQGRYLSESECKQQLVRLAELEFAIKSGALNQKTAIDVWFLQQMANP